MAGAFSPSSLRRPRREVKEDIRRKTFIIQATNMALTDGATEPRHSRAYIEAGWIPNDAGRKEQVVIRRTNWTAQEM